MYLSSLANTVPVVYLLVHRRAGASALKLGMTECLAARLLSLEATYGPFDLPASWVIRTAGRRDAMKLERTLAYLYSSAGWRSEAPVPRCDAPPSNGHTEWYQIGVLPPMLGSVAHVMASRGAASRLTLVPGVVRTTDSIGLAGSDRGAARLRRQQEHEAWFRARLARGETNFKAVREWFQTRRERLVSASRPEYASDGTLQRTLMMVLPTSQQMPDAGRRTDEQEDWREVWESARLWCGTPGGSVVALTYVPTVHLPAPDDQHYSVLFALDPLFQRAPGEFAPTTDLLRRVRDWVTSI